MKIIPNSSVFEEDRIVKELMSTVGINRVRGGTYNRIELTAEEINFINKEIWGAKDACTRCGRQNHFVKDCYASTDINGNKIYESDESECFWCCEYCEKEYDDEIECERHEIKCKLNQNKRNIKNNGCFRCGRHNHFVKDCYASTHIDGYDID